MTIIGAGRKKFVGEALRKMREERLPVNSKKYEKDVPENIRAAIAKVAGVENKPLAELSPADRRKLRNAAHDLSKKIGTALIVLASTCTESE